MNLAVLVNNAGVLYYKRFKEQTAEQLREGTIVNTYPYVLLTRALLPSLRKNSLIVNLASSASFQPLPLLSIYAASKVFDRFFSEALRIEQSQFEVLTVCPMYVQTAMTNNLSPSWTSGVTTCQQYV